MKIETRKVYDVLVVDMSGRLDSHSSGDAGDRIVEIAQGEDKRVLLNLDKLDYVSSAGLRAILRGAKLLQGHRGEFKIRQRQGRRQDRSRDVRLPQPDQNLRHREGGFCRVSGLSHLLAAGCKKGPGGLTSGALRPLGKLRGRDPKAAPSYTAYHRNCLFNSDR